MNLKLMEIEDRPFNSLVDKELIGWRKEKDNNASVEEVQAFAKKHGFKADEIHNYIWAKRKNTGTEKKITKFVESMWRFVFYAIFLILGYLTLFHPEPKSWIKDTKEHWAGWPYYHDDQIEMMRLYYQVELGCYIHQLMWTEVTRSDALEMILHHVVTITVMFFSWVSGFHRIGCSILLVHDCADVFLESAKCFNYTNKIGGHKWAGTVCDVLFGIFAVVFFVTRLIIYPRYMLWSLISEAPIYVPSGGTWPGYWVFVGLLGILQLLHISWFYSICVMIHRLVTTGIEKDVRSDDEDEDESGTGQRVAKRKKK